MHGNDVELGETAVAALEECGQPGLIVRDGWGDVPCLGVWHSQNLREILSGGHGIDGSCHAAIVEVWLVEELEVGWGAGRSDDTLGGIGVIRVHDNRYAGSFEDTVVSSGYAGGCVEIGILVQGE